MITKIYPKSTSTYLRLIADQLDNEKEGEIGNGIMNFFFVTVDSYGVISSSNRYVGEHSAMELLGAVEHKKIEMAGEIFGTKVD